jgi:hypothetical protein
MASGVEKMDRVTSGIQRACLSMAWVWGVEGCYGLGGVGASPVRLVVSEWGRGGAGRMQMLDLRVCLASDERGQGGRAQGIGQRTTAPEQPKFLPRDRGQGGGGDQEAQRNKSNQGHRRGIAAGAKA